MNLNKIGSVKGKNILFLQGPMGAFFAKLEKLFLDQGANTYRIGFNVGDYLFALKHDYTPYRGTLEAWQAFVTEYIQRMSIEMIMLFGDCRSYQSIAIYAAKKLGVEVMVFEEGYIRPDYITMERYGVNDYSLLPKDPGFYNAITLKELPKPRDAAASSFRLARSVIVYYGVSNLFAWRYPHYQHHRSFNAKKELYLWIRNIVRKGLYVYQERDVLTEVT